MDGWRPRVLREMRRRRLWRGASPAELEDQFQDVALVLCGRDFASEEHLRRALWTGLGFRAKDFWKAARRREIPVGEFFEGVLGDDRLSAVEDDAAVAADRRYVDDCLSELDPRERSVYKLSKGEQLSRRQVAKTLRLSEAEVLRALLSRVDHETGDLAIRTRDAVELLLPRTYLEDTTQHGHRTLDYGYAITGHKAQGMTTGKAFVLGTDDLYREWGYVAMSRGRVENHLYVVAPRERDRDEYAPPEQRDDPLEALIGSLEYSQAQMAGLDVAARDGISRMTTAELVADRQRLEHLLGRAEGKERELQRVAAQRAKAERIRDSQPLTSPAASAIEAHARDRVGELAQRQTELERAMRDSDRSNAAQGLVRYKAVREELDRRALGRVRAAVARRPDYLVGELGPYPDRRSERRTWHRAATSIENYRQDYGITDQRRALGEEPRDLRQRSAAREVRREIDRAHRQLGRDHGRRIGQGRELR